MLAFPCVSRGDESGIPWSEDLEATLRLARATGKPVLIHFYGDHCPPCKVLEKKAFRDPQLIDAIRTNLLPVKINGERDTKTAARYRITRWPTDVYLYPDGEEIYRNVSAQDPSVYEKTVLKVADKSRKMVRHHAKDSDAMARSSDRRYEPIHKGADSTPRVPSAPALPTEDAITTADALPAAVPNAAPTKVRVSLASGEPTAIEKPSDSPVATPTGFSLNPTPPAALANQEESSPSMKATNPVVVSLSGAARVRLTESSSDSMDTAEVAIAAIESSELLANTDTRTESVEPALPLSVSLPTQPKPDHDSPNPETPIHEQTPVQPHEHPAGSVTADASHPEAKPIELPQAVAMAGHCPVALRQAILAMQEGEAPKQAWVLGKPEHAVRHRGRIYHCTSAEALAKFLEDPDRYAPVLSGCDLIELSKSGRWIDGDCRYGFIEQETGRIFLFSSSLNCEEFAQNCESYSTMGGKSENR